MEIEQLIDEIRTAMEWAYCAGAESVHEYYSEDEYPEFGEAASDTVRASDGLETIATALAALKARCEMLEGALAKPEWFYADGYASEDCCDSVGEVVDRLDLGAGNHVVQIDRAGTLPSLWCLVHVLTDDEMEARETDEREIVTEYASEAEARAALAGGDAQ